MNRTKCLTLRASKLWLVVLVRQRRPTMVVSRSSMRSSEIDNIQQDSALRGEMRRVRFVKVDYDARFKIQDKSYFTPRKQYSRTSKNVNGTNG